MHNKLKTSRSLVNLKAGRNDWYRVVNKADSDTAEVYIYDEIGYFGITANDFVKELNDITALKIDLHLSTPGGDVFDGIAIYNALKNHSAEVTTYVDSLAASAGSFIAMAGDTIIMQRTAQIMIHDAHGLAIGNAADMRELADLLDKSSDNIASIYAERAGGSVEDWRKAMQAETWYSAEEAVEAGLADKINGKDSEDKTDNSWDLSIYSYAGRESSPPPVVRSKEEAPIIDPDEFRRLLEESFA